MGSRYIVTGTELGMLVGLPDEDKRKQLVDEIIDTGYICEDMPKNDLISMLMSQEEIDKLYTDLCRTAFMLKMESQCHEAQLVYKLILCQLQEAGIKPKVPNFWSDEFNYFPIDQLLDYFHANGWKHIRWVGDADCRDCFQHSECAFYGTGLTGGKSTKEKYEEELKVKMGDKMMLLKVIHDISEKGEPVSLEKLKAIILMCQVNGVPFSYRFAVTKDRRIIEIQEGTNLTRIKDGCD